MFERELKLFKFSCAYLAKVVQEMTDDEFRRPPAGLTNPPAHVVAHLAITNDSALKMLGQSPVCPPEWHSLFGMGAVPLAAEQYPSKEALLAGFAAGRDAIVAALPQANPEVLERPHGIPFLQATSIETTADLLAMLLTTHISLHVGQLSLMRRHLGHPPLF